MTLSTWVLRFGESKELHRRIPHWNGNIEAALRDVCEVDRAGDMTDGGYFVCDEVELRVS